MEGSGSGSWRPKIYETGFTFTTLFQLVDDNETCNFLQEKQAHTLYNANDFIKYTPGMKLVFLA
jgi:hypothetical protein